MADQFAEALRGYIDAQEVSKNQIIRESGIDRSSFFQYLNGRRMPGYWKMRKIAQAIGLSLQDRMKLERLYYRERSGEQFLHENDAALNCIRIMAGEEDSVEERGSRIRERLLREIRRALSEGSLELDLCVPSDDRSFYNSLCRLMREREGGFQIRQIFRYPKKEGEDDVRAQEDFSNALKLATSAARGYEACYIPDTGENGDSGILFPYSARINGRAFIFNHTSMIEIDDQKTIGDIREQFSSCLRESRRMIHSFHNVADYLTDFSRFWKKGDQNTATAFLSDIFCTAGIADEDLIRRYTPPQAYNLLLAYVSETQRRLPCTEYVSVSGLAQFMKDGKIYDIPAPSPLVAAPQDRVRILRKIREGLGSRYYLYDTHGLFDMKRWNISVIEGESVLLYRCPEMRLVEIDEPAIIRTFSHFIMRFAETFFIIPPWEAEGVIDRIIQDV